MTAKFISVIMSAVGRRMLRTTMVRIVITSISNTRILSELIIFLVRALYEDIDVRLTSN